MIEKHIERTADSSEEGTPPGCSSKKKQRASQ